MKSIPLMTLALALLSLSSCSVLTKSQVKNINVFAETTNVFADFPGELIRVRADLVMEERIVAALQMPDETEIKNTISDAQKNYKIQRRIADSMDLPFQLIKQYAVLLTKLSSGDYVETLNSHRETFESNTGSLIDVTNAALFKEIPPEAGTIFTEALFLVGERMTKAKQAKALKKFVPIGDTIIGIVTKKLSDILNGDLKTIMQSDSTKFFNTYTNIVLRKPERVNYSSVSQYAKAVDAFDNLEAFRLQCIESANNLAAAHKQLNRAIATKTKMTELIGETRAFGASVNKLYKLYKAIKTKAPSTENQ